MVKIEKQSFEQKRSCQYINNGVKAKNFQFIQNKRNAFQCYDQSNRALNKKIKAIAKIKETEAIIFRYR